MAFILQFKIIQLFARATLAQIIPLKKKIDEIFFLLCLENYNVYMTVWILVWVQLILVHTVVSSGIFRVVLLDWQ